VCLGATLPARAFSFKFIAIDVPGANYTSVHGISDAGQIVGWFTKLGSFEQHAFMRSADGAFTIIDVTRGLGESAVFGPDARGAARITASRDSRDSAREHRDAVRHSEFSRSESSETHARAPAGTTQAADARRNRPSTAQRYHRLVASVRDLGSSAQNGRARREEGARRAPGPLLRLDPTPMHSYTEIRVTGLPGVM